MRAHALRDANGRLRQGWSSGIYTPTGYQKQAALRLAAVGMALVHPKVHERTGQKYQPG